MRYSRNGRRVLGTCLWSVLLAGAAAAQNGFVEEPLAKRLMSPEEAVLIEAHKRLAVVNDEVILASEVYEKLGPALASIQKTYQHDKIKLHEKARALARQGLKELVTEKLWLHAAQQDGVQVTDEMVDNEIDRQLEELGSRVEFFRRLQERGKTLLEYEEEVKKELMREAVVRKRLGLDPYIFSGSMPEDVRPVPAELRRYYELHRDEFRIEEAIRFEMVELPFTPGDREAAQRLAGTLSRLAAAGADLNSVVASYPKQGLSYRSFDSWAPRRKRQLAMKIPLRVHTKQNWIALRVLAARLGWLKALGIGRRLSRANTPNGGIHPADGKDSWMAPPRRDNAVPSLPALSEVEGSRESRRSA